MAPPATVGPDRHAAFASASFSSPFSFLNFEGKRRFSWWGDIIKASKVFSRTFLEIDLLRPVDGAEGVEF